MSHLLDSVTWEEMGETMRRVLNLYRSSIGKKVLMAVTGALFVLFVIAHMVGNLKAFMGPEHYDEYAHYLREVGEPIFPYGVVLWIMRIVLLTALGIHALAALQTWWRSRLARPVPYGKGLEPEESTFASRTMRWGGWALFLFVIAHLLHFTVGTIHPDFIPGAAYHNLVIGFQVKWVAVVYVVVMLVLCLHVYHGAWSGFQTLGLNHPRYNRYRRPLALGLALVLFVGFASVPIAVMAGILTV
jgi:succinate dehydrogenase / fumarate reductase cytochrome b subunit